MAEPTADGDRALVVLDVNIFLDVAELVGEPFRWERFEELAVEHAGDPLPHSKDGRIDSLRAFSYLVAGRFADGMPVEVWTSDNIDLLVASKATQSKTADDPNYRGLGWAKESAQALIDDLVGEVVRRTGGGSTGWHEVSYGTPPLDHEDGCVYATVKDAGHAGVAWYDRYCVTKDGDFLEAKLPGLIDRMHPSKWAQKHLGISRAVGYKKMLRTRTGQDE